MLRLIITCKRIYDRYVEDEMTVYAAQASFFIVIAAFPFIMLLLTLIRFVPGLTKLDVQTTLIAIVPNMLNSFVIGIVEELYTKSTGTILSVTAITALWGASRGMLSIERGLNRAFKSQEKRNYIVSRLVCSGYTLVFMVVCIMCLLLLVFGNTLHHFMERRFPIIANVTFYLINFRLLLSLTILVVCFLFLYTFIPKKKQKMRKQLPGAVVTTVGWILSSYAFSIYFNNFSNFPYMYGSLTAVVLLMLWLYMCICIVFFGAEINYYYSTEENIGVDK